MLRQLLVGTAISVCNIAIHALMMGTVVHMSSRIAGAKDTVRQSRWQDRFDRSKMTHLRHRHDRNPAAQRSPVRYSFHSKAREALGNETARFHHPARRRGSTRGAAAARERPQKNSRMYGTFETVTR
jgi:hypothetical protein